MGGLSVIIVTYNSENVIQECLESIQKYNDIGDALEIIIVDNSPVCKIRQFVDDLYLDLNILTIHNPKNGGFGQGNNIGVHRANSEYLFFLNPDTILVERIFSYAISKLESNNVTSLGFKLIDRLGNINNSFGLLPEKNIIYAFLPMKILYLLVIKFRFFSKTIFPWGAAFMIKKDIFIESGMFDEDIFLCNEEPDLIRRVKSNNTIISERNIIHLEGHTTVVESFRFECWLDSTKYYFSKYDLSYEKFLRNEVLINTVKVFVRKLIRMDYFYLKDYVQKIREELNRFKNDTE